MPHPTVFIVAGEVSGDNYGAQLVRELKIQNPNIALHGLGGPRMQEAGCMLLQDMMSLAVVGFVEVLRHYGEFRSLFQRTLEWIKLHRPAAVVLIDYPGFNLRLAKEVHALGIKVIYYISPQVWAWNQKRVHVIRHVVDKLLVIFPFEKNFYAKHHMHNVVFVGHPLLDKEAFLHVPPRSFPPQHNIIGLLPGSRVKEIHKHLPMMLKAVRPFMKDYTIRMAAANSRCRQEMESILLQENIVVDIVDDPYELMRESACVLVASGTATVECACMAVPMIICYRLSFLSWWMAKFLVKVPFAGMVNILAQRLVVPELLQGDMTPQRIQAAVHSLLGDKACYETMIKDLINVRSQLGGGGASCRAAEEIIACL